MQSDVNEALRTREQARASGRAEAAAKFSGIKIKLVLVLLSITFALAVVEILCRTGESMVHAAHPHTDRPHKHYFPKGYQGDFAIAQKLPGDYRAVVIGDSFTFGGKVQLEDTYPKKLESRLQLNPKALDGRKIEVLNWGVPGWSTSQEILLVKRALRTAQPDLIVLQITLNDPEIVPFRVTHPDQDPATGAVHLSHPIFDYWHSLKFAWTRVRNWQLQREYVRYYFELFENPATLRHFEQSVHAIGGIARSTEVPVVAVLFPLFSHPFDGRYPFTALHEKVAEIVADSKLPFLDLLPSYNGLDPKRLQVLPGVDYHPNEIAYRIAADVTFRKLVREKLIPKELQRRGSLSRPLPNPEMLLRGR